MRKVALAVALLAALGFAATRLGGRDGAPSIANLATPALTKKPLRVLFLGNSFIYVNNLPEMIRHLAEAGDDTLRFEAAQECPGGQTFEGHWQSGAAERVLKQGHWDWVVLQEQSQRPSFTRHQLEDEMYPFARKLHQSIKAVGARPLFFLSWARRNGDRDNVPNDSFAAMQERLRTGYETIARELKDPVAPIGLAWKTVREAGGPELFGEDGVHPNVAGSYLAACVLYAMFYGHSPSGNGYTAGLDIATARGLQDVAMRSVRDTLLIGTSTAR